METDAKGATIPRDTITHPITLYYLIACSELPPQDAFSLHAPRSLEFARTQKSEPHLRSGPRLDCCSRSSRHHPPSPSTPQSTLLPQRFLPAILQAPPHALISHALLWACQSCCHHSPIIGIDHPLAHQPSPFGTSTITDLRAEPHQRPQSRLPSPLDAPLAPYCATALPIHSQPSRHFCFCFAPSRASTRPSRHVNLMREATP
jgi:hypothetical protein